MLGFGTGYMSKLRVSVFESGTCLYNKREACMDVRLSRKFEH